MQSIGFQSRAVGGLGHAVQGSDTEEVNHNGHQQYRNHYWCSHNLVGLTYQAAYCFKDDPTPSRQQEEYLKQCGQILDLAMTEVMVIISRLIADAYRPPGDAGGNKIGK
ncbi:hypothetical protein D3C75_908050 [compost metagenome]